MVPFLGAVLYTLFGINRIQRAAVQLRGEREGQRYRLAPGADSAAEKNAAQHLVEVPALADISRIVGQVTGKPLLAGNRVRPLSDGDEAYPAMLEAIETSTRSVTLCTYIFDSDLAGHTFVDALAAAVRRGVQVRVLVDAAGARYSWPRIDRTLRKRGVPVRRFLPIALKRLPYFNLRNHRKILVVDGVIGFTGGMNIRLAHWTSRAPRRPVKDVHFELQGPVVAHLQEVFAEDWEFASGEALIGEPWFGPIEPQGTTLARGIGDGPDGDLGALNWTILAAVGSARRSVRVVTPYFLPDTTHAQALQLAALRGVTVDIVVPARSNLPYMDWAMWGQFWTVVDHGVRLWLSSPPFDHTKLMVVDGHWVLFGSSNWDPRSLRLNFEFNVETYCDALGPLMDAAIDRRIERSRRVTMEDINGRPLPIRLRDSLARLASPYL